MGHSESWLSTGRPCQVYGWMDVWVIYCKKTYFTYTFPKIVTTFTNLGQLMTSLTWQEIDNLKLEHILIWIHTTFLHFIYMLSWLHCFTYIFMGSFYSEIYCEKGQAPNQEWQDFNKFWEIRSHLAHCEDYVAIILIFYSVHISVLCSV